MSTEEKKETQGAEENEPQQKTAPETEQPQKEEPKPSEPAEDQKDKPAGKASKKENKELKEKLEKLQNDLAAFKMEADQQKDRLMRTAAEYDNYRKRTEREKNALYASATADTVKEFLPVADNLERALGQAECSTEDLRKGIEMVQKQMLSTLEKLGVEPMGKAGEKFDAQLHNAVSHTEDDTLGENVIAEVYQQGYMLGDKVVRHAMVKVAN
ncbi:nucleotide exchange factor GrpE [Caproicibacterium lactatifermentans]|uniref:nucleotide exchange factor GrpE n=1 Tax=Caproicibacterium lactatifermentans TaxID=2666138 RepID=UPI001F463387|nr:nucleotide exchange factor GrpE [Caproicibacterium lactatifermentans]MDD4806915.1 nucleotide exchange factor GrpE [Oscillospiraceae bacterium]